MPRRVRAPVPSRIAIRVYGHESRDVYAWNQRFASELAEPTFAARETLRGRDARTLAREHAAWALDRLGALRAANWQEPAWEHPPLLPLHPPRELRVGSDDDPTRA